MTKQEPKLLKVTGSTAFSATQLGRALAIFSKKHSPIRIYLHSEDRNLDLVREGMDVGVRMGTKAPEGMEHRYLGIIRRVLVSSPSYLERRKGPSHPADIINYDCVTARVGDVLPIWTFVGPKGEQKISVDGHFRVNSALAERDAVLEGLGISLLPSFVVGPDLRAGRLVRVLPGYEATPLSLFAVFPASPSPEGEALAEFLMGHIGEMPAWDKNE